MSPAFIAIGVTIVVLAVGGAIVALTEGGPLRAGGRPLPISAPWIVVGALLLIVGIVLVPRLLGFTFLLLPLIWSRRRPRGPRGPGGPSGTTRETDRDPFDEDR
ncbi:MAG TPA: hypothetical protein VFR44_07970 [Actinomycetota bacterium]|nr:hypothetical protein [Actinomycetota bacterium]